MFENFRFERSKVISVSWGMTQNSQRGITKFNKAHQLLKEAETQYFWLIVEKKVQENSSR